MRRNDVKMGKEPLDCGGFCGNGTFWGVWL